MSSLAVIALLSMSLHAQSEDVATSDAYLTLEEFSTDLPVFIGDTFTITLNIHNEGPEDAEVLEIESDFEYYSYYARSLPAGQTSYYSITVENLYALGRGIHDLSFTALTTSRHQPRLKHTVEIKVMGVEDLEGDNHVNLGEVNVVNGICSETLTYRMPLESRTRDSDGYEYFPATIQVHADWMSAELVENPDGTYAVEFTVAGQRAWNHLLQQLDDPSYVEDIESPVAFTDLSIEYVATRSENPTRSDLLYDYVTSKVYLTFHVNMYQIPYVEYPSGN